MSISLDANVEAALDSGRWIKMHLVFFAIPGLPTGYWRGPRDLRWNGVTYRPSRYLDDTGLSETLGIDITRRGLTFSDVPTDDANDVIATIENYNYLNAPTTVTKLVGEVGTRNILGIGESSIYEINKVNYNKSALDSEGLRTVTVNIELEIPGRSVRDQTGFRYSHAAHQAHNSPSDPFFKYAATNAAWPSSWGRVGG